MRGHARTRHAVAVGPRAPGAQHSRLALGHSLDTEVGTPLVHVGELMPLGRLPAPADSSRPVSLFVSAVLQSVRAATPTGECTGDGER